MKKRILRCAAALLCACTVLGTGMTCYAATGKVSGKITKSTVLGVYEYPDPGHKLTVYIFYDVKDKDLGTITPKRDGNTAWGNNTSVSQTASAGTGYEFTRLSVYGYLDGEIGGSIHDLTP